MQNTLRITQQDRDAEGNIIVESLVDSEQPAAPAAPAAAPAAQSRKLADMLTPIPGVPTAPLSTPDSGGMSRDQLLQIGSAALLLAVLALYFTRSPAAPAAVPTTAVATAAASSTSQAAAVVDATSTPTATAQLVVAYWAPNGVALDQPVSIENHTISGAQSGWIQFHINQGAILADGTPADAYVWVKASAVSLSDDDQRAYELMLAPTATQPRSAPQRPAAAPAVEPAAPAAPVMYCKNAEVNSPPYTGHGHACDTDPAAAQAAAEKLAQADWISKLPPAPTPSGKQPMIIVTPTP